MVHDGLIGRGLISFCLRLTKELHFLLDSTACGTLLPLPDL